MKNFLMGVLVALFFVSAVNYKALALPPSATRTYVQNVLNPRIVAIMAKNNASTTETDIQQLFYLSQLRDRALQEMP